MVEPWFSQFSVVPAGTVMRIGSNRKSSTCAVPSKVHVPPAVVAVPTAPPSATGIPEISTFVGTGGADATSSTVPFSENVQTASPSAIRDSPARLLPAATVTYCVPSTSYVIGGAPIGQPVWNFHSSSPVLTSKARRLPSFPPLKTSPPAVLTSPLSSDPGKCFCQTILLVRLSIAVSVLVTLAPITGALVVREKLLPGSYTVGAYWLMARAPFCSLPATKT